MDLESKENGRLFGASQGIGAAVAHALSEEGCNVIIGARNSDGIRKLASEIRTEHGVEVIPHAIDLTDAKAVADLCHKIENDWEIDILLNNTGGPPPSGSRGYPMTFGLKCAGPSDDGHPTY